jgi:PAS domain S-box-containing protein
MINSKLGRLIIVDDEIETLNPLCDLLSEWGYEVKGLTSGKEALEALKKQGFDLLLTDLVMPEIDGIELFQTAQKVDPNLVCIIITGKGTIQTAVEAMKVGAFDYVLKPIEWKTFKPILSRAMDVRRLKKSEEKYRTIVEDQTELICRWKPGEILTFVNEPYCRYFNKKQEELLGYSFMTLIPEEDRDKVRKHLASLGPKNPVSTHEHRVFCTNGEICWQQWTNRAFFDEKGNIIEYQSVGRDITERKKMEEALKQEQYKLREYFENLPLLAYNISFDRTIVDCNNIAVRILGYDSKEELIGKPVIDTIYAPSSQEKAKQLLEKWKSEMILKNEELQIITKQGKIFDVLLNVDTIYDQNGTPLYSLSTQLDITERKRAEEALRVSEVKYRDLYDNAPDMYHTLDENGVIFDCNKTEAKMLGYEKKEIIGKHITDFFTEESKRLYEISFPQLREKKALFNLEREFIRKDGTTFPASLNVFSVYDKNRKFIGTKTIARDISVLKQAESALRESEGKLNAMLQSIADHMSMMDKDLNIIWANDIAKKIFGDEIIGKKCYEAYHKRKEPCEPYPCLTLKAFQDGKVHGHETQVVDKDGNIIYFHCTANVALKNKEGKPIAVIEISRDITERKRAEEELKRSEERLRSLADAAFEAIIFHKEGVLIRANNQFFKMFGYKPDELIGKQIISILVAHDSRAYMKKQIATGGLGPYESIGLKKDGTVVPVEIRVREMEYDGEKIRVAAIMDISEHKQREEELKKSYRRLRDLAARLSEVEETEKRQIAQELHDQVGQNLTALGINLNIIRSQISKKSAKLADYRLRDSLELLEKTTESIRNVMSDLRPSVLDDYGLLAGIRWYSEKFSARTNIAVKILGKELTLRLPMSVETTMFRITQEALTNIAKHSQAQKAVINLKEIDDQVQLSIADDGIGFDPETVYKNKREMVWGLHAMKERAEALGGKFFMESEPGKGTKIIVEIKR